MPVEIRELQIKTVVEEVSHQAPPTYTHQESTVNSVDIIALCVEQVMDILKQKNER